jgi:hypothetical protein
MGILAQLEVQEEQGPLAEEQEVLALRVAATMMVLLQAEVDQAVE